MAPVGAARHLIREQIVSNLAGLCPHLTAQQRPLDALAPPRTLAHVQRGKDAREQVLRAAVIRDHRTDRAGEGAVLTDGADQPAHGLPAQVSALALCFATEGAE